MSTARTEDEVVEGRIEKLLGVRAGSVAAHRARRLAQDAARAESEDAITRARLASMDAPTQRRAPLAAGDLARVARMMEVALPAVERVMGAHLEATADARETAELRMIAREVHSCTVPIFSEDVR